MVKRMILMLIVVALVLGAIGFVKYKQIQSAIAQGMAYQPPPEAVSTVVAKEEPWPSVLSAIGTVEAVRGVTVSADLAGIVQKITFESGAPVRAGDILVQLDTSQERAQLAAAEAQLELARTSLERIRPLRAKGITSQSESDRADAEFKSAEAGVGGIRATIAKKTIRAPFTGILGLRQINLGQYLHEGDPVVPLQALDPIHVNFSVPQQLLEKFRVGVPVQVKAEGAEGVAAKGKISAIDSVVDPATRNLRIQAIFDNADGKLRPGMFVEAEVVEGASVTAIALPASAIHHAPYGDSVFIVEDLKGPNGATYRGVRQQFVKLGSGHGDQVAILSGVKAGEEVVTSGVFKLRNGAAVEVNNQVQPGNDPAPKPEES